MGRMILILGGARSGKSRYAIQLAGELASGGEVVYLATAEAGDEEMAQRIARHRRARPPGWRTVEVPRGVATAVEKLGVEAAVITLDCITLWISNLLLEDDDGFAREEVILSEVGYLIQAARRAKADIILVSNEVGLGVVPPTRLGRIFRDLAGQANQFLAQAADEVYVMWAGLPQKIKGAEH
ncbi:MAG: bifunctional adenosylcobinamide kinase/adenosylcobinamide-phosphate guanylyltransferase [Anaerolineae bacterium]